MPDTPQTAVPVVGSTITRQARRLYVGNIPFGVTEVLLPLLISNYYLFLQIHIFLIHF